MTDYRLDHGSTMPDAILRSQSLADTQTCTVTSPKLGDPCQNCHERPSTTQYVGDGGALAWTHGFYRVWCDVCVLAAQLEHAREMAKLVPDLQRQLRNAKRRKRPVTSGEDT